MRLHERLSATQTAEAPAPGAVDPFAEQKNAVHLVVISELGPQLFNADLDQNELAARVSLESAKHLSTEAGLSRADRERVSSELADDILGHGPIERLLADPEIT